MEQLGIERKRASKRPPAVPIFELPAESLIPVDIVAAICGFGRSRIYALIQQQRFPAGVKLGRRARRWRLGDVLAWVRDPQEWTGGNTTGGV